MKSFIFYFCVCCSVTAYTMENCPDNANRGFIKGLTNRVCKMFSSEPSLQMGQPVIIERRLNANDIETLFDIHGKRLNKKEGDPLRSPKRKILRILRDDRDAINMKNRERKTPLECATEKMDQKGVIASDLNWIAFLMDEGATLDSVESQGRFLSRLFTSQGNIAEFIANEPNVAHFTDDGGRNIWHYVAEFASKSTVESFRNLVEKVKISGVSMRINAKSNANALPLDVFLRQENVEDRDSKEAILRRLGAATRSELGSFKKDNDNFNKEVGGILEQIYTNGIDNTYDDRGLSPLARAIRLGNLEMVKWLMEDCGANTKEIVKDVRFEGVNALQEAFLYGKTDIAGYIFKKQPELVNSPATFKVKEVGRSENTELQESIDTICYAIEGIGRNPEDPETIKYLSIFNNDINKEDNKGVTPLLFALIRQNERAVKCLLLMGANINKEIGVINKPIDYTALNGKLDKRHSGFSPAQYVTFELMEAIVNGNLPNQLLQSAEMAALLFNSELEKSFAKLTAGEILEIVSELMQKGGVKFKDPKSMYGILRGTFNKLASYAQNGKSSVLDRYITENYARLSSWFEQKKLRIDDLKPITDFIKTGRGDISNIPNKVMEEISEEMIEEYTGELSKNIRYQNNNIFKNSATLRQGLLKYRK